MSAAGRRRLRIGGASGFWGDSALGPVQLVERGDVDVLVFDYLAELTMSILAGARRKDPALGYATDFVDVAMAQVLPAVVARGIRVVANAGGMNPEGCAQALRALAERLGLGVRIAVVDGDDVSAQADALRAAGTRTLDGGALPARLASANAYLGAQPIRAALDAGAQVVITGRCVDSAVTLGALMHAFDWPADDWDRLAAGSLAGHLLECGAQGSGGLFTDWEQVPGWADVGYPIAECEADGSFTITKPPGTGGLVVPAAVAEQMLYEIGDPAAYLLPDVSCDFTAVTMHADGADRVRVEGARGRPPSGAYKVSATWVDGFRCSGQLTIVGLDAVRKAQRTGEAILERTRAMFAARGWTDYLDTRIEVLGAESGWGPHARALDTREAVLRVSVAHRERAALELFAREIAPSGTSWSPGTTGASGRPSPSPWIRQVGFLIDKARVSPRLRVDGVEVAVPPAAGTGDGLPAAPAAPAPRAAVDAPPAAPRPGEVEVPLVRLAWARSGDKGDTSNIGVIARTPALWPVLREALTPERVARWFAHCVDGPVTRHEVPGIGAFNFVLERALGGGGMASLRNDPLGKGMAQMLLAMPLRVPATLVPGERAGFDTHDARRASALADSRRPG